jgi:hypothetical protein
VQARHLQQKTPQASTGKVTIHFCTDVPKWQATTQDVSLHTIVYGDQHVPNGVAAEVSIVSLRGGSAGLVMDMRHIREALNLKVSISKHQRSTTI